MKTFDSDIEDGELIGKPYFEHCECRSGHSQVHCSQQIPIASVMMFPIFSVRLVAGV